MGKSSHLPTILLLLLTSTLWSQQQDLSYALPETVGMNGKYIETKVDSIMRHGIQEEAFPGAQVLVAKAGKIIFHEAYGHHTYQGQTAVSTTDIYDLASVTKILGPLPALMKLYEEGILDLDAPFSTYWKSWRHRQDKKEISLRELLAHQAGMQPYIVFLSEVMKKGEPRNRFVRTQPNTRFSIEAYPERYIRDNFNKKVFRKIKKSPVSPEKKYLYSGLASLIYPEVIADITGEPYERYIQRNFYTPLGCYTLGYNPSAHGIGNRTVPTEQDTIFRKALVQGWVHDENAALFGGVSGNAGLFGSARDLAIIMQMFCNYGTYGGKRYFKEETVREFTSVQYPKNDNRRGLGFDKPLLDNSSYDLGDSYPAPEVSPSSFGHSGFTGTFVWADPEHEMVFIFLSNRVYPSRDHRKLYSLNIRPALQQVFYQAMDNSIE